MTEGVIYVLKPSGDEINSPQDVKPAVHGAKCFTSQCEVPT